MNGARALLKSTLKRALVACITEKSGAQIIHIARNSNAEVVLIRHLIAVVNPLTQERKFAGVSWTTLSAACRIWAHQKLILEPSRACEMVQNADTDGRRKT